MYGTPSVNASLIHEIRMIVQHIFAQRTVQSMFSRESPRLTCALCLRMGAEKAKNAVTIMDGNAVCANHLATV